MSTMTRQVVYVAPDFEQPSGGVRAIYRHAELAQRLGADAKIWQLSSDFKPEWFSSAAPVVYGETLELGPQDVLVLPEVMVMPGIDPAPGVRKVIFNQNHFYTFDHWAGEDDYPGWAPAPHVWTASNVSVNTLKAVHPKLKVHQVTYAIDTQLFRFAEERKRKIVLMPRKRVRDARVLKALFRNDKRFNGVEVAWVDGVSEQEAANQLADASVFIALGRDEGFGLPVVEALAAGCAVVGYVAGGGVELFEAPGAHSVDDGDLLAIVEKTAAILAAEPGVEERRSYREWVEKHYSEDTLVDQLKAAITAVARVKSAGGTATHPLKGLVSGGDSATEQLERSLKFAQEQKEARERAESVATGLEEAMAKALAELDETRRREYVAAQELHDLKNEYVELTKAAERLTALDETTTLLAEYARDNDRLSRRLDEEIRQHLHWRTTLQDRIDDLERSTSWRFTAPLRKATGVIKGGRNA